MEKLAFRHRTKTPLPGTKPVAIVGVVASGNLEVLFERAADSTLCEVAIETPVAGYGAVWDAVVAEFVARCSPGGIRITINDAGARPDTVFLRLLQGARLMEHGP